MEQRTWGVCGLAGGLIGAGIGAGLGLGVAAGAASHDGGAIAAAGAGGAAMGASLGALIAHDYCDPLVGSHERPWPELANSAGATPAPTPLEAAPTPAVLAATTPAAVPPKNTLAHEKIVLRGVHFDPAKADVRPGDEAVLDETADILKTHPNLRVNIDGYCDDVGSPASNQKLSEQRAQAVAAYLVAQGVAPDRILARGYGKTAFLASNQTAEGRAENRRVELMPEN
jgi:outer membrane protein OmpA-like peptidoglycan-associated protein